MYCVCVSIQYPATSPGLNNMTSTNNKYFILTKRPDYPRHVDPGCICYSKKFREPDSSKKLGVFFMGSYTSLDYDIELSCMEPLSAEEAELLLALHDDAERLKWFKEEDALRAALGLTVGTEVTVEEEGHKLRGIIRYTGRLTEPLYSRPLSGTFFGIELQVRLHSAFLSCCPFCPCVLCALVSLVQVYRYACHFCLCPHHSGGEWNLV